MCQALRWTLVDTVVNNGVYPHRTYSLVGGERQVTKLLQSSMKCVMTGYFQKAEEAAVNPDFTDQGGLPGESDT